MPTSFFAVELLAGSVRYRLVKDLSVNGFGVTVDRERVPAERIGDRISMEFPLPGSPQPVRVDGQVVYTHAERGVGVRIVDADRPRYAQLLGSPPPQKS